YAQWRTVEKPLPERCGALFCAFRVLGELCQRSATPARLSTFARIAGEIGDRSACARTLDGLVSNLRPGWVEGREPFWPACTRFEASAASGRAHAWFVPSAIEQFERVRGFSSFFGAPSPVIDWLCQQPLASIEMQRRRVLLHARAGHPVEVPPRLCTAA